MTEPVATTYTKRLGMLVPGMDDEMTALRPNWDRLDNTMAGAIWVADGVTPEDNLLFEGALIAEIDSGKVWRAQRNQSGVYEKKWIKYPWCCAAAQSQSIDFGANNVGDHEWGFNYVHPPYSKNASMADLVNSRVRVPINGLYTGTGLCRFGPNAPVDGARSIKIKYNEDVDTVNTEVIKVPGNNANGFVICTTKFERILNAGDTVVTSVWQSSSQVVIKVQTLMTIALVRAL
jgi:hypothetical protein